MSRRPKMLASAIREIISPVLRDCPPECGIVSITEIDVSDDFSHATAYVGALSDSKRALEYLQSRVFDLQRRLSVLKRINIPMLRFRIDPRSEHGSRIDALLR